MRPTLTRFSQLAAFVALTLAGNAFSQAGIDAKAALHVAEMYACSECHNPTMRVLGPSFNEIAAKYKDDKNAMDVLSSKVRSDFVKARPKYSHGRIVEIGRAHV